MKTRSAFTLIELLVVILIIGVASALLLPTIYTSYTELGARSAARIIESSLARGPAAAMLAEVGELDILSREGVAGLRFMVDEEAWPITRITDPTSPDFGKVDPSKPLVFNKVVKLVQPPIYSTGRVNSPTPPPAGFITTIPLADFPNNPTFRRIILEESLVGFDGRAEPTNWYWNLRLGDVIEILGGRYTVCGPMIVGPSDGNSEQFVNIGLPGHTPEKMLILDRGNGPLEWLCLTNRVDDDKDGVLDDGYNGLDDDLNGFVDDNPEWEPEDYVQLAKGGFTNAPYRVSRRLVPFKGDVVTLPANVVIDASRWNSHPVFHDETPWTDTMGVVHNKKGFDYTPIRSHLPIDLYTGYVDIIFDRTGRVTPSSMYGISQVPFNDNKMVFWVAAREDVGTEIPTLDALGNPVLDTLGNPKFTIPPLKGNPFTVTLDRLTGDVKTNQLDPNGL